MAMTSHPYASHRTRTHRHRPSANEIGFGWKKVRRKYIRKYCDESNVQTDAGREECEKVCANHFCCLDTATDGYSCQYDESITCEGDSLCQNVLVGLLDNSKTAEAGVDGALAEVTSLTEDNDSLMPPSAAWSEVSPPLFDYDVIGREYTAQELQEIKVLFDNKNEKEKGSPKDNLVLMELKEEMGIDRGIVQKYLTRSYDPADPATTCYDILYRSDEDGDSIIQKHEYINFIAGLSEGYFDPDNYIDFPFAFKVNFIYLSCQCKFLPMSEVNGGEECCIGSDTGIYISGTGPQEVPTSAEEESHLKLVCLTAQGTIDHVRGDMPQTLPTKSHTRNPVTDGPTSQPTVELVTESYSKQPTYAPYIQDPGIAEPTQAGLPINTSPSNSWHPSSGPSTEFFTSSDLPLSNLSGPVSFGNATSPSFLNETVKKNRGVELPVDAGDTETESILLGVILVVIIFAIYAGVSAYDKMGERDVDDQELKGHLNEGADGLEDQVEDIWESAMETYREENDKKNGKLPAAAARTNNFKYQPITKLESMEYLQALSEENSWGTDPEAGLLIDDTGGFEAQQEDKKTKSDVELDLEARREKNIENTDNGFLRALNALLEQAPSMTPTIDEDPILCSENHLTVDFDGNSSSAVASRSDVSTTLTSLQAQREDNDSETHLEGRQEVNTNIQGNNISQALGTTLNSTTPTFMTPIIVEDPMRCSKSYHSFNSDDHSSCNGALNLSFSAGISDSGKEEDKECFQPDGCLTLSLRSLRVFDDSAIAHIPLKIHSSQPDSRPDSQPVEGNATREDLIAAIEADGWTDTGAVASHLPDSTHRPADNALQRDPCVSFRSDTDTENSASANDEMVMGIDWQVVVSSAVQVEEVQDDETTLTPTNDKPQQQNQADDLVRRVQDDKTTLTSTNDKPQQQIQVEEAEDLVRRVQDDETALTPTNDKPQQQIQAEEAEDLVRRVVLDEILLCLRRLCCIDVDRYRGIRIS